MVSIEFRSLVYKHSHSWSGRIDRETFRRNWKVQMNQKGDHVVLKSMCWMSIILLSWSCRVSGKSHLEPHGVCIERNLIFSDLRLFELKRKVCSLDRNVRLVIRFLDSSCRCRWSEKIKERNSSRRCDRISSLVSLHSLLRNCLTFLFVSPQDWG